MIIGICGGTGSGKTTIARAIVDTVGAANVVLVEQDSYYRDLADMPLDERHQANFDHPDSIDSNMMVNHILRLKQGLPAEMPLYDFRTHTRTTNIEIIEPRPVVIVEGILIFAEPRVLDLLDVRVFVDTPDDVRLIRRLKRDHSERPDLRAHDGPVHADDQADALGVCRAVEAPCRHHHPRRCTDGRKRRVPLRPRA